MKTEFHDLPNGLRLAVLRNPGLKSTAIMAGMHVGSRHEREGLHGAAHFAEHIFFKGTKRRPTAKAISTEIEALGGDLNAFTDKEWTAYHAHVSMENAPVGVDLIHDMMANALFRPSDIEKERPVIREEISMYDNEPGSCASELSEMHAYQGTSLAHRVTGNIDDVSFTPGALKRFQRHHYTPTRTIVAISGAVDDITLALAKKKFGSIEPCQYEGIESFFPPAALKPGFSFAPGNTDRLHFVVRFPGLPSRNVGSPALWLLGLILGGYSSARLFQSLREDKSLCYGISAGAGGYSDTGSILISTELDRPKFPTAIKAILKEIKTLRAEGVTKTEIANAKTHYRGTLLIAMDQPMQVAAHLIKQIFTEGKYQSPEKETEKVLAVKGADINEAIRTYLDPDRMHVQVVGPKAAHKEVAQVLASVQRA
jgi:predicted Zn-dependent peptidase